MQKKIWLLSCRSSWIQGQRRWCTFQKNPPLLWKNLVKGKIDALQETAFPSAPVRGEFDEFYLGVRSCAFGRSHMSSHPVSNSRRASFINTFAPPALRLQNQRCGSNLTHNFSSSSICIANTAPLPLPQLILSDCGALPDDWIHHLARTWKMSSSALVWSTNWIVVCSCVSWRRV